MDLRVFYHKMRKLEKEIEEPHVVVVSLDTSDGGKAEVKTEVTRECAARMIVEGCARLASVEETRAFRRSQQPAQPNQERPK